MRIHLWVGIVCGMLLSNTYAQVGLVWNMVLSNFAVGKEGLYCVYTNTRGKLNPDPAAMNILVGVMADVPESARRSSLVRAEFDTIPGYRIIGAGVLVGEKKGPYIRILLFRDEKMMIAEATVPARRGSALLKKKVYPAAEWRLKSRANELVFDRRNGRVSLNGREILRVEGAGDVKLERVALFGGNRGVMYRRLRLQTVGSAVNAASQGMVENTVTVLDEVFGTKTVLRQIDLLGLVIDEAGGVGDVMGP